MLRNIMIINSYSTQLNSLSLPFHITIHQIFLSFHHTIHDSYQSVVLDKCVQRVYW